MHSFVADRCPPPPHPPLYILCRLLGTVLRAGWNFDGYVTSDCDADSDVYNTHHYTATPEEAVADVLHAGTDGA